MNRKYRRLTATAAVAALMGVSVAGCSGTGAVSDGLSLLSDVQDRGREIADKSLDRAAQTADAYCENVAEADRIWLRDTFNARTETATLTVDCGDDE